MPHGPRRRRESPPRPEERTGFGKGKSAAGELAVTVLGNQTPYPRAGGSCPAYLVTAGATRVLVDCGPGAVARLRQHVEPWELDAVVLSHLHGDHWSDLLSLRYAVDGAIRLGRRAAPLPVYAPDAPAPEAALIPYRAALEHRPVRPGGAVTVGALTFEFHPVEHPIPTCGMTISAADPGPAGTAAGARARRLAYSADTRWAPGLAAWIQGADALLVEATYDEAHAAWADGAGHLTGRQAGRLAADAGVAKCLLTHFTDLIPEDIIVGEAREIFPAAEATAIGRTYMV